MRICIETQSTKNSDKNMLNVSKNLEGRKVNYTGFEIVEMGVVGKQ